MKIVNAHWMSARLQPCASRIGPTNSVHAYCRLAISIMQRTPSHSCAQRPAGMVPEGIEDPDIRAPRPAFWFALARLRYSSHGGRARSHPATLRRGRQRELTRVLLPSPGHAMRYLGFGRAGRTGPTWGTFLVARSTTTLKSRAARLAWLMAALLAFAASASAQSTKMTDVTVYVVKNLLSSPHFVALAHKAAAIVIARRPFLHRNN